MCGIAGFLDISGAGKRDNLNKSVIEMTDVIRHRGPDDSGAWVDETSGIALGFRRLAILDLSPTGHQPMLSSDGRYVIIFNGEIYNFLELRENLSSLGHSFQGTSDTEVMLAAILQWGLEKAVSQFNGMFAFALWDCKHLLLHLVRDRLGVKPLYYGWQGKKFLFGSELKSLRTQPEFKPEIDRQALTLLLRHNCIPGPYSIYKGISKLSPGTILTLHAKAPDEYRLTPYWSVANVVESSIANPYRGSSNDAVSELEKLLLNSVGQRMISDVPLGAFLSGGIDSSLIVALMQAQSDKPIKTFTIGFEESGYDEALYAREVAGILGTNHTELYLNDKETQAVIPELPALYDEPFADSSQIPTYLVSQLASQHVTVSLSGDGGDELFGGYNRYTWVPYIQSLFGWMPLPVRRSIASLLGKFPGHTIQLATSQFPARLRLPNLNDKLIKLQETLETNNSEEIYFNLISHWKHPEQIVRNAKEPKGLLDNREFWPKVSNFTEMMMYLDMISYLPDDILVKLDRASMGASLEGRVPFIDDHNVVEFAWQLPMDFKIRNGKGKWILREILSHYIPRHLIDRPKMGFGVPIGSWLRGGLRDWAEDLLSEAQLDQEGFFNSQPIRQKWDEHLAGKHDWHYYLWDILMFQAWYRSQK